MIITYRLPPTSKLGNHVKARSLRNRKSVTLPWDEFLNEEENHQSAFRTYISRFLSYEKRPFAYATLPNGRKIWILVRENNTIKNEGYEMEGIRDPEYPCDQFTKKEALANLISCTGDGHYLCKKCVSYVKR